MSLRPPMLFITCALVCACMCDSSAIAGTITASALAPTVDGADIANLDQTTAFENFGSSFLWTDRPARGQTFMTGSNTLGYVLDAVTVQANPGGGNAATVGTASYNVRVGTVSGTSFATVIAETGSFGSIAQDDFVTYMLNAPITLLPDTLYGFDIGMFAATPNSFSTVGWELRNNTGAFAGGRRYSSGGGGTGGATVSFHALDEDRIFHVNLETVSQPVPEPSSFLVFGGCFAAVGLTGWRRKQRKAA